VSNTATDRAEDFAVLKKLVLILGAILLVAVAIGFRLNLAFERFSKVQRGLKSLQPGDSRDSVRAKYGLPNYYSGNCGKISPPRKSCASEWIYSSPLAPIDPHYLVITFSADDRVISAEEWASP
jgi:hypothetical protein